jgi:hypothetical protein
MRAALVIAWSTALALLAPACGGCKDKPAAKNEAAQPDRDEPVADRTPDRDRDRARPRDAPRIERPVRRNAPLSVADAIAAVPQLAGVDLSPPATSPSGMQVRFTRCIKAGSIEAAGEAARASLDGSSWSKLALRPPEGAQSVPRYGIAAEKNDLRLSVTIRAVRRSGCDETVGEYFMVATMNRVAPPGAAPSPDDPPDPPPENE